MTASSSLPRLRDLLPRIGCGLILALTLTWAAPGHARELTHRVESGQYLVLIAKRYHTTAEAIRKRNGLKRDQTLRPGMSLRIVETEEHRQWRAFLDEREEKKRRARAKAEEARRAKERAARVRRDERRAEEARRKELRAKKARQAKRRAEKARQAKRRAEKTRQAKRRAEEARRRRALADRRRARARVAKARTEATRAKRGAQAPPAKPPAGGASMARAAREAPPIAKRVSPTGRRAAGGAKERAPADVLSPKHAGRAGLVTLRRHRQTLRTQLVHEGALVEREAHRVDRLLRSLHTGETKPMDRRLLLHLAALSDRFGGRTIVIISGYRPGGEQPSRHQLGRAVDLRIEGVETQAVFEQCKKLPGTGCGFYPRSSLVHIDTRARARSWIDAAAPGEAPRFVDRWPPPSK